VQNCILQKPCPDATTDLGGAVSWRHSDRWKGYKVLGELGGVGSPVAKALWTFL